MNVNKVILIGNLGNDPQQRTTSTGKTVTSFRVATSEKWTDQSGQPQEKVNWHNVVVWGKRAEACARYLAKGRRVYVEGKLENRSYEDKEGVTRYVTDIVANEVVFLDGNHSSTKTNTPPTSKANAAQNPPPPTDDESIPF